MKELNLDEILEFVAYGKDCKIVEDEGILHVLPIDAYGYGYELVSIESWDYEECDGIENFLDWLNDCLCELGIEVK